jgi:hypothetical protein
MEARLAQLLTHPASFIWDCLSPSYALQSDESWRLVHLFPLAPFLWLHPLEHHAAIWAFEDAQELEDVIGDTNVPDLYITD